jgi:2-polyprenyl-3-methyl-5-hydroxy-6-metoxy-1,4-benzoquinol methylase
MSDKELELAYQAARAATMVHVRPTPTYTLERYRQARHWRFFAKEFVFHAIKDPAGKRVLDFGCGEGEVTTQLAWLGARVTGMDISPELLDVARKRADLDGVQERVELTLGDILESPRPANRFDIVICNMIMHHVDLYNVFPMLMRTLKPGGLVVLNEPIAFSPFLQRIRDALPLEKNASPGERQLNQRDIQFFLSQLANVRVTCFNLCGRLSRLLPNQNRIDKGHPFTKVALLALLGFDRLLLMLFPFLGRYCGLIVIVGEKRR